MMAKRGHSVMVIFLVSLLLFSPISVSAQVSKIIRGEDEPVDIPQEEIDKLIAEGKFEDLVKLLYSDIEINKMIEKKIEEIALALKKEFEEFKASLEDPNSLAGKNALKAKAEELYLRDDFLQDLLIRQKLLSGQINKVVKDSQDYNGLRNSLVSLEIAIAERKNLISGEEDPALITKKILETYRKSSNLKDSQGFFVRNIRKLPLMRTKIFTDKNNNGLSDAIEIKELEDEVVKLNSEWEDAFYRKLGEDINLERYKPSSDRLNTDYQDLLSEKKKEVYIYGGSIGFEVAAIVVSGGLGSKSAGISSRYVLRKALTRGFSKGVRRAAFRSAYAGTNGIIFHTTNNILYSGYTGAKVDWSPGSYVSTTIYLIGFGLAGSLGNKALTRIPKLGLKQEALLRATLGKYPFEIGTFTMFDIVDKFASGDLKTFTDISKSFKDSVILASGLSLAYLPASFKKAKQVGRVGEIDAKLAEITAKNDKSIKYFLEKFPEETVKDLSPADLRIARELKRSQVERVKLELTKLEALEELGEFTDVEYRHAKETLEAFLAIAKYNELKFGLLYKLRDKEFLGEELLIRSNELLEAKKQIIKEKGDVLDVLFEMGYRKEVLAEQTKSLNKERKEINSLEERRGHTLEYIKQVKRLKEKGPDSVLTKLKKALDIDPSANELLRRANFYDDFKDYRNVELSTREALQDPELISQIALDARLFLANALFKQGKFEESLKEYDLLLSGSSDAEVVRAAILRKVQSYERLGRLKEAEETLRSLSIGPDGKISISENQPFLSATRVKDFFFDPKVSDQILELVRGEDLFALKQFFRQAILNPEFELDANQQLLVDTMLSIGIKEGDKTLSATDMFGRYVERGGKIEEIKPFGTMYQERASTAVKAFVDRIGRNIETLERGARETKDLFRKEQIEDQIEFLKKALHDFRGATGLSADTASMIFNMQAAEHLTKPVDKVVTPSDRSSTLEGVAKERGKAIKAGEIELIDPITGEVKFKDVLYKNIVPENFNEVFKDTLKDDPSLHVTKAVGVMGESGKIDFYFWTKTNEKIHHSAVWGWIVGGETGKQIEKSIYPRELLGQVVGYQLQVRDGKIIGIQMASGMTDAQRSSTSPTTIDKAAFDKALLNSIDKSLIQEGLGIAKPEGLVVSERGETPSLTKRIGSFFQKGTEPILIYFRGNQAERILEEGGVRLGPGAQNTKQVALNKFKAGKFEESILLLNQVLTFYEGRGPLSVQEKKSYDAFRKLLELASGNVKYVVSLDNSYLQEGYPNVGFFPNTILISEVQNELHGGITKNFKETDLSKKPLASHPQANLVANAILRLIAWRGTLKNDPKSPQAIKHYEGVIRSLSQDLRELDLTNAPKKDQVYRNELVTGGELILNQKTIPPVNLMDQGILFMNRATSKYSSLQAVLANEGQIAQLISNGFFDYVNPKTGKVEVSNAKLFQVASLLLPDAEVALDKNLVALEKGGYVDANLRTALSTNRKANLQRVLSNVLRDFVDKRSPLYNFPSNNVGDPVYHRFNGLNDVRILSGSLSHAQNKNIRVIYFSKDSDTLEIKEIYDPSPLTDKRLELVYQP